MIKERWKHGRRFYEQQHDETSDSSSSGGRNFLADSLFSSFCTGINTSKLLLGEKMTSLICSFITFIIFYGISKLSISRRSRKDSWN